MVVTINVTGQKMIVAEYNRTLAPESQKFAQFKFNLSADWDGLTVFAQFKQGENAYNEYLDANDCAYLPHEITAGLCTLMLYGTGGDNIIGTTVCVVLTISENGFVADASSTEITQSLYDQMVALVKASTGSPLVASTAAAMTDHNKIYVYTGSETGYTYGNWYYYNGSAWQSGGAYNSAAVNTDTTLTLSGVPADAKATGDAIDDLKSAIKNGNLNQMLYVEPFVIGSNRGELVALRSTLTITETGLRANWSGGGSSFGFYAQIESTSVGDNAGHKIYYNLNNLVEHCASFLRFRFTFASGNTTVSTIDFTEDSAEGILTLPSDAGRIMLVCSVGSTSADYFTIGYAQIIDLTRMFGAGNEPSLEVFKEIYGAGMPYAFRNPVVFESLDEEKALITEMLTNSIKYLGSQSTLSYTAFSNIATNGFISFTTAQVDDFTDKPDDLKAGGICISYRTASAKYQIIQSVRRMWFRSVTDSGSISPWISLTEPYFAKWYALGDSITYGTYSEIGSATGVGRTDKNYVALVSQYNAYDVTNLGEGGMGYLRGGNTSGKSAKDIVDENSFSDADLITLAFGTNDWGNYTFGTADDAITANTVCGAMKYCVEKIMTKRPNCKLVVIGPMNSFRHGGTYETNWALGYDRGYGTLQDLIDAIKSVCTYYNVQFLDMTQFGPVNRQNIATLLGDGLHPTIAGYELIAKVLRKAILM